MNFDDIKKVAVESTIGVVVSLLFLLLNGMGMFSFLYNWANYLAEPIIFGVGQVSESTSQFFSTFIQIKSLKSDNIVLEKENSKLSAEIEKNKEIQLQNEILLSQIGTELTKKWELSEARILGVDQSGPSEHVVIDLGSDDDIEVGDPVIIGEILVGDVREVYKSTARVRLITNRNSNVSVMDRDTRAKGLVRGSLEGLIIEDVLESEDLAEGDIIISWSDELPDSLIVGTIRNLVDDPSATTRTAYIEPAVSLENLDYVFVMKGFK